MKEANSSDETVLRSLAERSRIREITDFSDACSTCRRTGGDLNRMIQRSAELLSHNIEIQKEKEVLMEEKIVIDGTEYLVGHTREYVKAAIPWEEGKKGAMITGTMASMLNDEVFLLG